MSPLATLQRGYAVLQDADGRVVTSVAQTQAGADLHARVSDGRIHLRVQRTSQDTEPGTEPGPDQEDDR
jgi:exodeoxyribonuclease VII large subunit